MSSSPFITCVLSKSHHANLMIFTNYSYVVWRLVSLMQLISVRVGNGSNSIKEALAIVERTGYYYTHVHKDGKCRFHLLTYMYCGGSRIRQYKPVRIWAATPIIYLNRTLYDCNIFTVKTK
jgi:hypothetical protein